MAFPNTALNQVCVYWGSPVPNGYGWYTFAEPVELDCRWVDTTQVITDNKGKEIVSKAEVQVAQDLDVNSILYLGTLDDLDSGQEDDPRTVSGAFQIRRFDKTPTVKADVFYRAAYL